MSIPLIDSHCHPQFPQYDQDREEMIKRALNASIQMICVGTDLEMSEKAIELAQKYEVPILPLQSGDSKSRILDDATARSTGGIGSIWASVGLHPNDVKNFQFSIFNFQKLLEHPRVVAVGEVGLDYYRIKDKTLQNKQKEILIEFFDLAISNKKPLIIHCREAYDDIIKIIGNSKISGVIHSFTSDFKTAEEFLDKGFFIGFNGIITFTDQYNETVAYTPLSRILLETDAPYLAPVPYRGKRNEPSYIIEVAQKIAELKGVSVDEVAEQTTKNCQNLFKIT